MHIKTVVFFKYSCVANINLCYENLVNVSKDKYKVYNSHISKTFSCGSYVQCDISKSASSANAVCVKTLGSLKPFLQFAVCEQFALVTKRVSQYILSRKCGKKKLVPCKVNHSWI